jgi:hypothetical protein
MSLDEVKKLLLDTCKDEDQIKKCQDLTIIK